MGQIFIHGLAELEMIEASQYYENESKGLGLRFLDETNRIIKIKKVDHDLI